MRCTSSDLIIAAGAPDIADRIVPPLISDCRVPKGQETVKVETLDRLHRGPLFEVLCERAQPQRLEATDDGCRMQEGHVAEPLAQAIVAHGRGRIDVLFLRQPSDRRPLVADLVDELERDALPAGEDTAVGHAIEIRVVEMPARLPHSPEPGVGIRTHAPGPW